MNESSLKRVQFSTSGMRIEVDFDTSTLRGAIPIDDNGDEVPDRYDPNDKLLRVPCERFLDIFTVALVGEVSFWEWTTDASMNVEITSKSVIKGGDLFRIRPNVLYAGKLEAGTSGHEGR